jgi:hypothetical protein
LARSGSRHRHLLFVCDGHLAAICERPEMRGMRNRGRLSKNAARVRGFGAPVEN